MHGLTAAAPLLVLVYLALCPPRSSGLSVSREATAGGGGGGGLLLEEGQAPSDSSLFNYILNLFSHTPYDTFGRHSDSMGGISRAGVPKRMAFSPRLGKRGPGEIDNFGNSGVREKRETTTAEGGDDGDDDTEEATYGGAYNNWWWPLVTARRSPFVPRAGKRGDDLLSTGDSNDLYDSADMPEDYLVDDLGLDTPAAGTPKRNNGFAFSPRLGKRTNMAFVPRLGKKTSNFAFVPRVGKRGDFAFSPRLGKREFVSSPDRRGDFAFTPRLGKKSDFAGVPRPERRGDFAFSPRLGKKSDFAFNPRLGKKADFAFSPRLGKREAKA